jgi:nicotinamidase-related amidase
MEPLIIVDLQKAFPVPPKLVAGIRRYARRFERRIFTRFENPANSVFRKLLKQRCCAPGTRDTALLIEPTNGDLVITKRGYGLEPRDIRRIKALGAERVTVCGIDTDACVLAVMFSLFDAGIDCRVKPDLCWSSSGLHQPALKIIKAQFPPPKRAG